LKRLLGVAATLVLAALAASSFGQEKPPAAPARKPPAPAAGQEKDRPLPPVSESVDVSITNVEVFVTDSKGQRVAGLTTADFEVRQDGVPQKITNFYAVAGGKVLLEDGTSIPLGATDKDAAVEVPREVTAHYVFYVDNLNIQPQNRNRMFKRLKEFIPQVIGPNAEGMVVTFNRSVKIRKAFTNDPKELLGALEDIELDTGGGTNYQSERRDAISKINDAKSSSEAQSFARTYALALRNDLEFTVDAIQSTINSLAGLQGRKNFVYMSEGLPATAGLELYEAIREKFQDPSASMQEFEYDMNAKYVKIVSAANANGVTVYTLDASGLTTSDLMSAENRTTDVRVSEFFVRQNMQGPIRMMAEETGGIAAINTNDWKASLDQIASDFSNFYSLGYRSAKGASDRPHKIEVSVKKKGLKVRTRTSFVEKSVETKTAEAVLASLHYSRSDNPLQASMSVGEPKPYDSQNYLLPVRISVPIGKLGLLPSGDRYEGQFFVYFAVLDVSGKQSDLQIQKQPVTVPAKDLAAAQRKDFYFDVQLIVVPGGQKLAVGVRDGVSNLTSYLQKNVFVSVLPKEKPTEPARPGTQAARSGG
jgi:VWFA-related protein